MRALAKDPLSSDSYRTANYVYGSLSKATDIPPLMEPDCHEDGHSFFDESAGRGMKSPDCEFELTMVPSAGAAIEALKHLIVGGQKMALFHPRLLAMSTEANQSWSDDAASRISDAVKEKHL